MFSIAVKLTNTNLPVIRFSLGQSNSSSAVVKSLQFNVVRHGKRYTLLLTVTFDTGKSYQFNLQWTCSPKEENAKQKAKQKECR